MKWSFLILAEILSGFVYCQAPGIEWQNTLGSTGDDILSSIHQSKDGGYILGGYSNGGISGDKTEINDGFEDYWVVKLNSYGIILWQKSIGGNSNDILTDLELTSDGGYILGGYSNSLVSGDKTENSIAGSSDYWVVKLDSLGLIQWQNTIGGAGNDYLYSIKQTTDHGYILGGYSNSPISGDKSEASDIYYDYWVVKIDSTGTIQWNNTIGGSEYDYLYSSMQTSDGGYLIGGMSTSPISGDKADDCISGSNDYWILHLDNFGDIEWQNTIGGSGADWLNMVCEIPGKGYILGGYSSSGISGNKTTTNCDEVLPISSDYWILMTDSLGVIQWESSIGGTSEDKLQSIEATADSGFIAAGYSSSGVSCAKTDANIGFNDYWIIKTDTIGQIKWQKTIGGWTDDILKDASLTNDGGYILGGYSSSPESGDKTEGSIGGYDFWIIKLAGNCAPLTFYQDVDDDGFGNNTDSILACFPPLGFVSNNIDCNDTNSTISPGAPEVCNTFDDNCNFIIDEGLPLNIFYDDMDLDGFGNQMIDTISCLIGIVGYVLDSTDCNDTNPSMFPGAIEILNGLDDNCNDIIDEGFNSVFTEPLFTFDIFPNPNYGSFYLVVQANIPFSIIDVKLIDLIGNEIYFDQFNSKNQILINLPNSFSGIAIIQIAIGGNLFSKLINVLK